MAVNPHAGGGPPEPGQTLTGLLEVRAAGQGSRVFALLPERRSHLSFADLNEDATRFANVLHALGLRTGDRVVLILGNGRLFLATLFGALKLGAWAAVVDPGLGPEAVEACLRCARPKAVAAAGDGLVAQAAAARERGLWNGELVAFGSRRPEPRAVRGERLLEAAPRVIYSEIPRLAADHGGGGLITFTYRPPGRTVGVMLPERALAHVAAALAARLDLKPTDRTVPLASLAHRHGIILGVLAMLYAGGTVVLTGQGPAAPLVESYRATWLLAPPAVLAAAAPEGPAARAGRTLAFVLAVPGPLDPGLRRYLSQRWGVPVLSGYGRPETTWVAACDSPRGRVPSPRADVMGADAVGRPLGCRLAVAGPDGSVIEAAPAAGEILVQGENVMRGYMDDPAATRQAFHPGGWLRTGDRGLLAADGTLHLISRQAVA